KTGGSKRSGHPFALDVPRFFMAGLQPDLRAPWAYREDHGKPPRRHIAQGGHYGKRHPPILADIDMAHRSAEPVRFVEADETVDECAPCNQLHFGVERAANRKASIIELLFPVTLAELAADFFGKIAGGKGVWRQNPRIDSK